MTDFKIFDGTSSVNVESILSPYEGRYDQVLLTLYNDLNAGKSHIVTVNNLEAYSGNVLGAQNAAAFVGFGSTDVIAGNVVVGEGASINVSLQQNATVIAGETFG